MMTNRKRIFILEYLKDFNATRSAKAAGYSERTARSIGQRLTKKDSDISTAINTHLGDIRVKKLESIANRCQSYYVYLIQEDFMGFVKIGIAVDPMSRLRQLQTSCPQKITLLAHLKIDDAIDYEVELHARYSDKHYRGEWFRLSEEDITTIRAEWENLQ